MPGEGLPDSSQLTVEDFAQSGWDSVLSDAPKDDYSSMWLALRDASEQAIAEDKLEHGKVLKLLGDACSMRLSPSSRNEPFRPLFELNDGTCSTSLHDFIDSDVSFFLLITCAVDNPRLRARLADLIWVRKRNFKFALTAIDGYRLLPLNEETWTSENDVCWSRAIDLSRMLGQVASDRLAQMECQIIGKLMSAKKQHMFFAHHLARILRSFGLGRNHLPDIAAKLESLAREFEVSGNFHASREYFESAAAWFNDAGDEDKSINQTIAYAEGWAKEAIAKLSSDDPSHLVAAVLFESAIQVYRTIPRAKRGMHQIDQRLEELRVLLVESGEKSLDEMKTFSASSVDISEYVEKSRVAVSNRGPQEALREFATLHRVSASGLRELAINRISEHPHLYLFPMVIKSHDGRVIATRPGLIGSSPTDADDDLIRFQMVFEYDICVNLAVHGLILPGLEAISIEHWLREIDFIELASLSPIVPKGREVLFGKALFAGFDRDFVTALHLLAPQMENMVRFHLKEAGAKTTTLHEGVETENSLSTLMESPKAEEVFGEDSCFEIKALYCDPYGSNLRNNVAHGLYDYQQCHSVQAVYAWWFALKLVLHSFWNASRDSADYEEEEGES